MGSGEVLNLYTVSSCQFNGIMIDLRSFSFPSSIPTAAAAAALPSLPSAAGSLGPAALLYTLPNPAGLGPSLFNGLAGMLKFSVNVGFG